MFSGLYTTFSIRWCNLPAYTWLKARNVIAKQHQP